MRVIVAEASSSFVAVGVESHTILVNVHVHARETSHQTTGQVLYNYPNEI
jgi:hypothetical protein